MSSVSYDEFADGFARELGMSIAPDSDTPLAELEEYDSMGRIQIGILIEELFGFEIDHETLIEKSSLRELYEFLAAGRDS